VKSVDETAFTPVEAVASPRLAQVDQADDGDQSEAAPDWPQLSPLELAVCLVSSEDARRSARPRMRF
jgi:hypothetical protein